MSTAESAPTAPIAPSPGDCPTETLPTVPTRRSILHAATGPGQGPGPFAGWRDRAPTEELAAVPAPRRRSRPARRSACRHSAVRRRLRSALIGTLPAVVAVSGLSSYAAAGVTDARPTALCQARTACR